MFPESKCIECPIGKLADDSGVNPDRIICFAQKTGHARFCEFAEVDAGHRVEVSYTNKTAREYVDLIILESLREVPDMPFDPSVKGFAGATQEERGEERERGSDGDNREGSNGDSRERLPTGVPAPWRSPIGPSLLRKVLNLTRAVAQHIATGGEKVSEEVHERRLAICRACVGPTGGNGGTGYWNAERGRCEHPSCGCNMQVKTWMSEQVCPIGKWVNEEEVFGNS